MAKNKKSAEMATPKETKAEKKARKRQEKAEAKMLAELEAKRESFQEFLPIKDIKNGCFIDDMGYYYPVIVLGTINSDLMSKDQINALARGLEISFSSLLCRDYQCLMVPMPYDISLWRRGNDVILDEINDLKGMYQSQISHINPGSGYSKELDELQGKIKQLDIRAQLLRDSNDYVIDKLHAGRMTTKKSYLIPNFRINDDIRVALENSREIVKKMNNNGIECRFATEQELRDLLYVLFNPLSSEVTGTPRVSAIPNINTEVTE